MKIQFGMGINRTSSMVKSEIAHKNKTSEKKSVFDELTVSARENRAPADIIENIKKQASADIISGTSVSDLDDIKLQIARGNYEANAAQIANKILFDIM